VNGKLIFDLAKVAAWAY